MSLRFFKIFAIVVLVHILVLNLLWVGFSAPIPRLPASFTYEGSIPQEDEDDVQEQSVPGDKAASQFVLDHLGVVNFNHWVTLRDPSKLMNNAHLGF